MTDPRINIVIPMAGAGSRFADAGYDLPKPFIDVDGKPMIGRVIENLALPGARYILIGRREHMDARPDYVARLRADYGVEIVTIEQLTEGTAATLLFAREFFADDTPMLVANCDQLVDGGIAAMVADFRARRLDGSIMVFEDKELNPKWSFVRLDDAGLVVEAKEKQVISNLATVGIYLFGSGRDFIESAIDMIIRNDRTNREFYTCPVYNYLIAKGARIGIHTIPFEAMHGIGTPEDLKSYLAAHAGA